MWSQLLSALKIRQPQADVQKLAGRRSFFKYLLALISSVFLSLRNFGQHETISSVLAQDSGRIQQNIKQLRAQGAKVAHVRLKTALADGQRPDEAQSYQIIGTAVCKLTGKNTIKEAFSTLFAPSDIVGIKVNALAGPHLVPHWHMLMGLVNGLLSAGIKKENIIIWDRTTRELRRAGYQIAKIPGSLLCLGTDELPGGGYGRDIEMAGSVGSCFSRILTDKITALVNFAVLKDHDLCGVAVGMKNYYGVIHNPNKYHENGCDPYIADLCSSHHIQDKLRLTLCDAFLAQYNGGPAYKSQWTWPCGILLASLDPVAIDAVGYDLIAKKRQEKGLPSLKEIDKEPKYLETACQKGLGESRLSSIHIENSHV